MLDEIIKFYKKLPEHGLYNKNEIDKIKMFKQYIDYFKNKTQNLPDVLCLKKKLELEKKGITDSNISEYNIILDKIKKLGIEYMNIGKEFENNSFDILENKIQKIFNINLSKIIVHKNKTLFIKENNEWQVVGEVDAIIIYKDDGINYILAICEIKNNFDDIPDAQYQIERSFKILQNKGNDNVRLNKLILDDSYKLYFDNILESSLIISKFDPKNNIYLDVQSKLKFILLMMINIYNSKPKKIIKRISKKQKNKRYSSGVLNIIDKFKEKSLDNRIIIL